MQSSVRPTEETGTAGRVGAYRLLRELGRGSMGTVFEAIHDRIGRRVALKVLNARLRSHPQALPRLLNEARAVNLIEHPGLVEVYDCFETQDGGAAIVMELLRGESLHERLERGAMPEETARIGRQIAEALTAAHERGIVHRDLKPENVMLLPDPAAPAQERIKILDFGLAKIDAGLAAEPAWQVQTRATTLLGTPRYMAPEQCKGAGPVDDRADVYALGVILYQMMAGHPPFDAAGVGELLAMHIYAPPPPLAGPLRQGFPLLSALIDQMLQKDPAHRPAMAEVAATLAQVMQPDRTVIQPHPPQPERPPADTPAVPLVPAAPPPRPALPGPSLTLWCEPEEGAAAPEPEVAAPPRRRGRLAAAVAAGLALAVAVALIMARTARTARTDGRLLHRQQAPQAKGAPAAPPAGPALPAAAPQPPPPPVAFPLAPVRAAPPAAPAQGPARQEAPRATRRRKATPAPPTETRIIESNADVEVLP